MTTIRELLASGYDIDAPLLVNPTLGDTAYDVDAEVRHADSPGDPVVIVLSITDSFVLIADEDDDPPDVDAVVIDPRNLVGQARDRGFDEGVSCAVENHWDDEDLAEHLDARAHARGEEVPSDSWTTDDMGRDIHI
jgi:hypothetical protein